MSNTSKTSTNYPNFLPNRLRIPSHPSSVPSLTATMASSPGLLAPPPVAVVVSLAPASLALAFPSPLDPPSREFPWLPSVSSRARSFLRLILHPCPHSQRRRPLLLRCWPILMWRLWSPWHLCHSRWLFPLPWTPPYGTFITHSGSYTTATGRRG
jgi:hypothetical protein